MEEFKLQEASKSLKKLEDRITQKEQKLSKRANVLEPEEPVTIFNIKAKIEEQKALQYALKHEKNKNALLQKEKVELASSLKEKDDVILNQASKLKNQQQKFPGIEKQLSEEIEKSNDLLNIKISNKELRYKMINTSKKKLRIFDLLIQIITKHIPELIRNSPSFIHDLVNIGILSDKDIDKDCRQNTRHDR